MDPSCAAGILDSIYAVFLRKFLDSRLTRGPEEKRGLVDVELLEPYELTSMAAPWILACPHCGGRLRLIATLHDPVVIRKILAHLALGHSGQSPGPAPPESGAAAS